MVALEPLPLQLHSLGLGEFAAEVYAHLLHSGARTPEALAAELDRPVDGVRGAVLDLAELGMATLPAPEQAVSPLDPASALALLARRREAEFAVAAHSAIARYETYRRGTGVVAGPEVVEVLTDDTVQRAVIELQQSAVHRVRALDTAPYGAPSYDNPAEIANLARGVVHRVVYAQASVEDAQRYRQNIQPCIAAGEQARVVASVPVKLMIVDDRVALVSFSSADSDYNRTALLVRRCSLLPALAALFEACWRVATPLTGTGGSTHGIHSGERQLLRLLAAGATDEIAARNLGISRRTVTRRIERLMAVTGATSRFQLALKAVEERWI
ncbi:helix-turn-helix transcriptional regulator [Kutzneria albida]|uniref:HTH luxR-type domain-containing protein n=1 Tax=Kutzneria albida DSM 43870 TaxID=1449976 RepID=W5W7F6_9PSEU|nr:helix-turn-helix transcriptional regulator [Kutzneria albida]AHH96640.1 hypothetical protein KALB_3273 [Kutzneria albida DSM 43870]